MRTLGEGLFALPLYLLFTLSGGPAWQATLPFALQRIASLLALPLGVLADRIPRRELLAATLTLQALIAPGLLLKTPILLTLCGALFFTLSTLTGVTASAYLADLAGREDLERVRGRVGAVHIAVDTLKDPFAGLLVTRTTYLPSLLSFAAFLGAAFLYRSLPSEKAPTPKKRFRLTEVWEGVRFLWQAPNLRPIVVAEATYTFVFALGVSLLPFLLLRVLEESPLVYGIVSSLLGMGSFLGSLLGGELSKRVGRGKILVLALLLGCGAFLSIGGATHWIWVGLGAFLLGLGSLAFFVVAGAIRLGEAPPELRGRVAGGFLFLSGALAPLGPLLGGALAGVALPFPFLLAGGLLLGLALLWRRGRAA
ncbi:MFS transporter [Thermus scotoductus]|uniref:MFS transporter n=4 Tax=Thermus scotoductus TaxID=37636 RepID=A0A430RN30_THESC|nr:MFS transporter [Thermus scotoductus]RTH19931.1 MFS transporter [Thermus scotoductus]